MMPMTRTHKGPITKRSFSLRKLLGNTRGAAALEFALALPFLLALFVASTDLMRLMLTHQKVERIAYNVADLVSQSQSITAADLQQIFLAPAEIMQPFVFGGDGLVIVTSVHRQAGSPDAIIRWQCEGGGTLAAESLIGTVGQEAALPEGLQINERENVIVAEVFYVFDTWFPLDIAAFMDIGTLYKTSVFKPRFGSLLTSPC